MWSIDRDNCIYMLVCTRLYTQRKKIIYITWSYCSMIYLKNNNIQVYAISRYCTLEILHIVKTEYRKNLWKSCWNMSVVIIIIWYCKICMNILPLIIFIVAAPSCGDVEQHECKQTQMEACMLFIALRL